MNGGGFIARPLSSSCDISELLAVARQKIEEGQPSMALQAVVAALRLQGGEGAVAAALHRARSLYHRGVDNSMASDELSDLMARCALAERDYALACQTTDGLSHTSPADPGFRVEGIFRSGLWDALDLAEETGRAVVGIPSEVLAGASFSFSAHSLGPDVSMDMDGADMAGEDDHLRDDGHMTSQVSKVPILAESGRLQVLADASADGSSVTCPKCHGVVKMQRAEEHARYWCPGTT